MSKYSSKPHAIAEAIEAKIPCSIASVPLSKMRVSDNAQRDLRNGRVNFLLGEFDIDMFGLPVGNWREGHFYIVDGQHRIEALKLWLGEGWEKQKVDCRAYNGMTEQQEADMFDRLNNALATRALDRFCIRVTAKRPVECAINNAVKAEGLKVSRTPGEGRVQAVAALARVFKMSDADTLRRTLRIVSQSFGDPGLTSPVIDGVGLFCKRYNGAVDDKQVINKLQTLRGGVGAIITEANSARKSMGQSLPQCVAAAVVAHMNRGRGGARLPAWWITEQSKN